MAYTTVHAPRFQARAVAVAKLCHLAPQGAELTNSSLGIRTSYLYKLFFIEFFEMPNWQIKLPLQLTNSLE